jgi:hypothetical protein
MKALEDQAESVSSSRSKSLREWSKVCAEDQTVRDLFDEIL